MTTPDPAGVVERLRANLALPICPYDKRSPEYWSTPDNEPCKFCGGLPDGPDLCRGADTSLFTQAAALIETLVRERDEAQRKAERFAADASMVEGAMSHETLTRRIAEAEAERLRGLVEEAGKVPMQPVGLDAHGVARFKENAIVRHLLDAGPFDMNALAVMPFSERDREQFAQLIGYSVGGFSDLSYASDRMVERADDAAALAAKIREG